MSHKQKGGGYIDFGVGPVNSALTAPYLPNQWIDFD